MLMTFNYHFQLLLKYLIFIWISHRCVPDGLVGDQYTLAQDTALLDTMGLYSLKGYSFISIGIPIINQR